MELELNIVLNIKQDYLLVGDSPAKIRSVADGDGRMKPIGYYRHAKIRPILGQTAPWVAFDE
jgi:hypothetical protein